MTVTTINFTSTRIKHLMKLKSVMQITTTKIGTLLLFRQLKVKRICIMFVSLATALLYLRAHIQIHIVHSKE